jgi:hypothetical protein
MTTAAPAGTMTGVPVGTTAVPAAMMIVALPAGMTTVAPVATMTAGIAAPPAAMMKRS